MTHVLFAPHFDPAANRTSLEVPEGLTIAGIIAAAVPQLRDEDHQQLRVHVAGPRDSYIVPSALWPVCRPKQGMQVMLHLVPAGDGARAVLQTVVVVGAMALGQYWASALIPAAGVGQSLLAAGLTAGLSMVGNMLVNSLVPAQAVGLSSSRNSEAEATPSSYAINGWSNVARKGEPIPFALGQIRMAPPFGAGSYTEIYDDKQYVRTLFCFGYGPLEVDDIRIGDVPISEYDDVEIEIREGYESDEPVSLYPRQVIEDPDAGGVELVRNYPRDGSGQPDTSQTAELAPVVRLSATNATHATVIIGFPQGLFRIESNGDKRNEAVDIRIRQRLSDADEWQDVTTISVSQHRREAFYRAHTWELPSRGRWQIEVTRLTTEAVTGNSVPTRVSNTALAAIQSHRPEYPIAMSKPLTLVAVRCRATYQLNGQLDNLNAIVRRVSRDWDGSAWVMRASRNPASAYVLALQGNQNPFPEPD
ncbi:MAG: phage tail protein, partial [Pseudomonadota bacterium]|nr:phage tail protein [Pseudomonadota bacterium]